MATVADKWILVNSPSPDGEPVVAASGSRGLVAFKSGGGIGLEALGAGGSGCRNGRGVDVDAGRRWPGMEMTASGAGPPQRQAA
jgi:hypothetical protein